MTATLFIALSLLATSACVAVSWRHWVRASRLTATDARALSRELRALPGETRLPELARRSPPGSWERRFAADLMEAGDERARIAAANELLGEVEHRLREGAGWPPAAVRLSLLVSLKLAVLSFFWGAGTAEILTVLSTGVIGAGVSAVAGRAGRTEATRQREAIDALVAAAVGSVARRRRRG